MTTIEYLAIGDKLFAITRTASGRTIIRDDIEWQNADEQVDELLIANKYEFDEDGTLA